jgi:hypothetical protein
MSLKTAVAYCRIDDSFAAGEAAMKAVMKQLEGQIPNFLFLFATVGHDLTQLIQGIHSVAVEIFLFVVVLGLELLQI